MNVDLVGTVVLTIFLTVVYLIIGIGTSRMVATIKDGDILMPEILLWPAVLVIFAVTGDVA